MNVCVKAVSSVSLCCTVTKANKKKRKKKEKEKKEVRSLWVMSEHSKNI